MNNKEMRDYLASIDSSIFAKRFSLARLQALIVLQLLFAQYLSFDDGVLISLSTMAIYAGMVEFISVIIFSWFINSSNSAKA